MNDITFSENAIYSVDEVARILRRNPRTVRSLCKKRLLASRDCGGSYLIGGWAIKDYISGRLILENENDKIICQ